MSIYQPTKISRKVFFASLILFLIIIGLGFYFTSFTKSAAAGSVTASIVVDEPAAWYWAGYFPNHNMSSSQGYAPFPVFFQGTASAPRDNIISYAWDFGTNTESDPHGRTFNGFNAAHVFEKPGTYTVTLTVTDYDGHTSTAQKTITVLDNTGTTYYVDSTSGVGDDSCDGKAATVISATTCPWKTATKAFSHISKLSAWYYQPGDRVLFNRGQTYDFTTSPDVGNNKSAQGFYFGAYGTGDRPLIQYVGTDSGRDILSAGVGLGYAGFIDLRFNFLSPENDAAHPAQKAQLAGLVTGGALKNMLFLRDEFIDSGGGAANPNGPDNLADAGKAVANFFVIDNIIHKPITETLTTTGGLIYAFGVYNYAMIGNTFEQSGNHFTYNSYWWHGLVSGNTFSRPPWGRTAFRLTNGSDVYVADNKFLGWREKDPTADGVIHGNSRYNWSLVEFAPSSLGNGAGGINNLVFERNVLTNYEQGLLLDGVRNSVVRNNLFVSPDYASNVPLQLAEVSNKSYLSVYPLTNLKIIGNTVVANGSGGNGGSFVKVTPWGSRGQTVYGSHHDVTIANNIFYAVSGSVEKVGATEMTGPDIVHFSNNIYYIPSEPNGTTTDPFFQSTPGIVTHVLGYPDSQAAALAEANGYIDALHLSSNSTRGTGYLFNTDSYFDFDKVTRYDDGTVDIGAFESTYNNPVSPPPTPNPSPTPACQENWNCTAWSTCVNNNQTKTCTDLNSCGTVVNKPAISQSCSVAPGSQSPSPSPGAPGSQSPSACQENWNCTNWTTCTNNNQTKSCTDLNHCGTVVSKPSTSQACSKTCSPNWQCIPWNTCTASKQTRTCTDSNKCNLTLGKPTTSQTCVMPASQITPTKVTSFLPGRLIKLATSPNVYYLSASSTRHLFTNMTSLNSWLANQKIETISAQTMNTYKLNNNATLRPGTKLIRFTTNPKIYMVTPGAKLCQLGSPSAVTRLYGTNWPKKVVNLPTNDFKDYIVDTTCYLSANSLYPDGTVLTYQGSPAVWYIENQKKRYVGPWAFKANNFSYDFVLKNVPTSFVYPSGNRL